MIEAGAAGVHFEDQLASVKKCGHMGGKVLVPTREAVEKLIAARLAADCMGVPTIMLARTDAEAADLVTSDIDDNDRPFLTGERTVEGFYKTRNGLDQAVSRGLAYARVRRPDLVRDGQARPRVREAVRRGDPGASSRARCSRTTARRRSTGRRTSTTRPSPSSSASSARWATSSSSSRSPASTASTTRCSTSRTATRSNNMTAFVELQEAEFAAMSKGFTAVKHQREVGTGYFDAVTHDDPGQPVVDDGAEELDRRRAVLRPAESSRRLGPTLAATAVARC